MNSVILVFKGFLIGIGKIIPGVSGSLIAITLGVYDRLLEIIGKFYKNIKENIKFIFPLGFGIIMAIMSMSKVLSYLLNNYYVITMLFFIGLIMGGIPCLINKKGGKKKINVLCTIISFLLVLSIYFIKINDTNSIKDYPFYIMFLIGVLDAATMIVPGISGTAIMMILGCYSTILDMFSNLFLLSNLHNLVPFSLGLFVGLILISRIISFLLKRYSTQTNYCILGFTFSSIFLLMFEVLKVYTNISSILIGLILMIIGFLTGYITEKK